VTLRPAAYEAKGKSARCLVTVGAASTAKASSEGWRLRLRPNSVALGKEGSANSTSAKPSLPSTFSRALGTDFAECQTILDKEKPLSRRRGDGDGVFAECSR
jgi:hypothetical protein